MENVPLARKWQNVWLNILKLIIGFFYKAMNLSKILIAVGLLSSLAAQEPSLDSLNQIISSTLQFWRVPGCAVSITRKDQLILAKGYGTKEAGKDAWIDSHTVFPIASITKLFTAATVGRLVDRGTLDWDSPGLQY